jgi:hypothetical protein
MQPVVISRQTERRFVLGRQGLWPGRRWQGLEGTAQAALECEAIQLDPLVMVARSQEICLYSRVLDYQIGYLDQVAYEQRRLFDYGGALFLYPMQELPYWAPQMNRQEGRWPAFLREHAALADEVRSTLRERGPLSNRDLEGNHRVNSYRGRKDTALALYALWMTGEVMVHHRKGFDRVYDLRENVAPPEWNWATTEEEAETYFARKSAAFTGIARERGWALGVAEALGTRISQPEGRQMLERYYESGLLTPVRVEGAKDAKLVLTADLPLLDALERGEIPAQWQPLGPTTLEEAVILPPLDIVSARGRAARLFDFEYVWEVYKPVEQRRWGYYNVPLLYGDRLVARIDPRLDRKTGTLELLGFWLDDESLGRDAQFGAALAACLRRFMTFLGAKAVTLEAIQPAELREMVRRSV